MSLIDISQSLAPSTAVWPGDQSVEWTWTTQISDDAVVNLGALRTSVHAATHADAPLHVDEDGASIDQLPLKVFVGPAQVVSVDAPQVLPEHVARVRAPRVLFKTTYAKIPPTDWTPDALAPVAPETVDTLANRDVVLVGTDGPSVDPVDSKTLPAHHALNEAGIAILENLALADVEPGMYDLMACPIRIHGADAAPVRAVLRPMADAS